MNIQPQRRNGIRSQGVPTYLKTRSVVVDGCWVWQKSTDGLGYPKARGVDGELTGAHRISYEYYCGHIPDGYRVTTTCGNILCIAPGHLACHPAGFGNTPRAAIQRTLALHSPNKDGNCTECTRLTRNNPPQPHPCPTTQTIKTTPGKAG